MLFIFSCILLHLASLTTAQTDCSNDVGNYTTNSNFKRNLNSVLSSLDSNTQIDYGFYNLSVGQPGPDQANVIALCRGDIGVDDCQNCIRNSSGKILQACPNQKEAIGFEDTCILRYSNKSIFGVVEDSPKYFIWNTANATDVNQFNQALQTLMSRLRSTAASGNSLRKFATGDETAGFNTIYGLVQCTPDLSEPQCDDCIAGAIQDIATCCDGKRGARIRKPSCNLRYEVDRFYGVTPATPQLPASPSPQAPSVPPPPPPAERKKRNNARTIIIIVVSTVSVVILMISCICLYLRIRKPKEKVETVDEMITAESLQVDFSTIRAATDDFSEENKLGQGGFGSVYKGTLSNGQEVAVKRLSKDSGQGDLEFKNEVLLVAKLQHRNLVRLQGFCLQGIERLLIYEFVLNASLDHFIFNQARRAQLDWERRHKIIGGIARGLLYLHEDSRLRIIHRDLKASNILLDADMNPKISDFGMARLFVMDETQGNTSRIVVTYGYMAPEYAMHGQFSVKSDVFSFGVLILEIVSGQKNNCFRNGETVEDLLSHAWRNWREGTGLNVIDPALITGSRTEMMRCIHIGLLCVQENIADRPTMASIVLMLSSHSLTLPVPSQPAFFMNSSTYQSDISSSMDYNSRVAHSSEAKTEALPLSANEASITELYPR
ncbi:cysteine-rich receptor-like protein kinase 29 [Populus alba]|uniref:Receptor-like protein kinase n=1 Tax=Populus alba x Populus x berolinensis TaxID=444605 RepID=A0AAD6R7V5_9ROSI|nr:putative receptor-like protein kinase At4g00960 [Populus alba]KAJ7003767.1 receptor-like protein kinase [Populus alba x Populus x berolinensis]